MQSGTPRKLKGASAAFFGIGIALLVIAISGQTAFVGVGMAFVALGAAFLAGSRKEG